MKNKVIVIFGASGSGKSTLAQEIIKYFKQDNVVVISQDDYYLGCDKSSIKSFDEPEALDFELLENHLELLVNNQDIESPIYNFDTHLRENESTLIEAKPLIILDGTMVMTSSIIEQLSCYSIYCDIEIDICFIRRLNRDLKERGRGIDETITQYLDEVRPSFFKYISSNKSKSDFLYDETNKSELFNNLKKII